MNWIRSDDFFNALTNGNYLLAKKLFDEHDSKLHNGIADPAILTLYTDFHPFCLAYDAGYSVWDGLRSSNKSATQGVVNLVDDLMSNKARAWDTATQQVYPQGSVRYTALFPNKRVPFQTGTVLSRVNAITNLITAIGSDASLAAVKTSVQAYLTLLIAARTLQSNQLTSIDAAIIVLEAARLAAGSYMIFVFGTLMAKFYLTPKSIDVFYPIALLTSRTQLSFVRNLVNQIPNHVFKRKLDAATQTIETISSGDNIVRVYFTNGLTDVLLPGELFVDLPPHSTGSYNPLLMNYSDDRRHCYVLNMSTGLASVELGIA